MRGWSRRVLALFLPLLALACGERDERFFGRTTPVHGPDEVWLNIGGEPEWLDPGKCSDSLSSEIVTNLFAGLVQPHPATLEPMPELARAWEVSPDGRVWTFHLRPSTWSDGHPLTARDFEWSWRRVVDPATAAKYASLLYVFEGAEAWHQGAVWVELPSTPLETLEGWLASQLPPGLLGRVEGAQGGAWLFPAGEGELRRAAAQRLVEVLLGAQLGGAPLRPRMAQATDLGVRALDDLTLEVRLVGPLPYFLHLIAFYTFMPTPRHVIEGLAAQGLPAERWTQLEHLVTNGPYRLVQWRFRQRMVFEKNPRYWAAEAVKTPRIVGLMVESYNTTLNLYRAAELDWIGNAANIPAEFQDHVRRFADFMEAPYLSVYFYWINTRAPGLTDARVRKALSLAIDRAALVEHITRGGQTATASLVPAGLGGYQALDLPLFDPARARALLEEAGHPRGEGLPPLSLSYNTSEGHKQIAEAVQAMWKEHLGLKVEIENQEWKVYLKNLQLKNFQIARHGWIGDFPDPYTYLELLTSANGNNHSKWASQEYDHKVQEANTIQDPALRLARLREAEALMMDAQPLIPFYVYSRSQMVMPYLRGFWTNYQDRHPWKYLYIDPRWYEGVPEDLSREAPPPLSTPEPLHAAPEEGP